LQHAAFYYIKLVCTELTCWNNRFEQTSPHGQREPLQHSNATIYRYASLFYMQ